jgi:hypothetical protein
MARSDSRGGTRREREESLLDRHEGSGAQDRLKICLSAAAAGRVDRGRDAGTQAAVGDLESIRKSHPARTNGNKSESRERSAAIGEA